MTKMPERSTFKLNLTHIKNKLRKNHRRRETNTLLQSKLNLLQEQLHFLINDNNYYLNW